MVLQGSRPAYTTVQTIVQRLEQNGAVRRTRKSDERLRRWKLTLEDLKEREDDRDRS